MGKILFFDEKAKVGDETLFFNQGKCSVSLRLLSFSPCFTSAEHKVSDMRTLIPAATGRERPKPIGAPVRCDGLTQRMYALTMNVIKAQGKRATQKFLPSAWR